MGYQLAAALVGVWLMAAPAVLGYGDPARANDRIVGPVAATFATIAVWEVTRACRWVNLPLGAWMLAAPFLLGGYAAGATTSSLASGLALAALAFAKGRVTTPFGGGWSALWRDRDLPRARAG